MDDDTGAASSMMNRLRNLLWTMLIDAGPGLAMLAHVRFDLQPAAALTRSGRAPDPGRRH
jgi:hypothetical protein